MSLEQRLLHKRAQKILDRSDEHRDYLDRTHEWLPETSKQIRSVLMALIEELGPKT